MMRTLWMWTGLCTIAIVLGCGADDMGGPDGAPGPDANQGCTVPVAGMTELFDWPDTEPNDTACQAADSGLLAALPWMGFGNVPNAINTNTDTDFYVFRTGDAGTLPNIVLQVCANDPIFDAFVYEVDANRHQGAMVASDTSATACQTPINGNGATLLAANSEYLLELRAKPGIDLGGTPGLYGA